MTSADGVDATFSATAIMELPRRLRHRRRGHREQPLPGPGAGGTVAMARLMNEEGNGERRDLA
jgi:hypothetical protein